jgi:tetratricopeptide (TPR) repeat protein
MRKVLVAAIVAMMLYANTVPAQSVAEPTTVPVQPATLPAGPVSPAAEPAAPASASSTSEPAGTTGEPGGASTTTPAATSQPSTRTGRSRVRPAPASGPVTTGPAGLASAQRLYWTGQYAQASAMYSKLLANPADAVGASIGLANSHAAVGKYSEAIKALEGTAQRAADDADWHVTLADLYLTVGKYDEALTEASAAVKLRPDWPPAILIKGMALETVGKKDQAKDAYKAVAGAIAQPVLRANPRNLVAIGQILDRYGVLCGQKASEQAANILNNYLQEAYRVVDKDYWPANVASGMFLLSKYMHNNAGAEFALAEKVNKNIAAVHAGRGAILLQDWQFEQAIAEADAALNINPNLIDALLVRAGVYMQWRKFDMVEPELKKALTVNPQSLDALSMMAALHVRLRAPDKAQPYIDQALAINPVCADVYDTIGQWLAAARQFPEAERNFKKAMELAPEQSGPVTNLGLMYMQTGDEDQARATLDKAFALDDYRADVLNYVNLLKRLKDFSVKETEHFIIKVDPKMDAVLLEWVAAEAERVHGEVCKDFDYTPPNKTILELFPTHQQFSVRITGKGWIGTVGACTGRVIAMPAPDPLRGGFGSFNWAVVLRHEFTHAVTLAATDNRIPHWFTEACAVWEQPDRRNFEAVRMLVDAVRSNGLFPVKELDWGFIRPRTGGARTLAYAQSELIFEYLVQKKKYDVIVGMIHGFRDGWAQAKVFTDVVGMSEAEFDKDFAVWARQQVQSWGFDPIPVPDLNAATTEVQRTPASADAHARLAMALLNGQQIDKAEAQAKKALDLDPRQKYALWVLGNVQVVQRQWEAAIDTARRLEDVDPRSPSAARIHAEGLLGQHKWMEAIAPLNDYKARRPDDQYSYEKLADLYSQLGDSENQLPNLVELHKKTLTDPKYARQIAEIYKSQPDKEDLALSFYRQVIDINPYDSGAYQAMTTLDLRLKRYPQAVMDMNSACQIEPENAQVWTKMSAVYYRASKAEKSAAYLEEARAAAKKALTLDPNCPAGQILEQINRESPPPPTSSPAPATDATAAPPDPPPAGGE